MRNTSSWTAVCCAVVLTAALVGCDDKPATPPETPAAAPVAQVTTPTAPSASPSLVGVPTTDAEKFSYMLGVQLASSVPKDVVLLDSAFVSRGIEDTLNAKSLKIRDMELQKLLHQYSVMLKEHKLRQQAELAQQHGIHQQSLIQSGQQFLEHNRATPGVTELPNGVQYAVLQAGKGKRPTADSTVQVHYFASYVALGKLVDFGNSYSRQMPATYKMKDVIPGWQSVLPLMQEGARYRVTVPAEQGHGKPGITGGDIPEGAVLVYEMELLSVK